jgi:NAD+ diphosphatase
MKVAFCIACGKPLIDGHDATHARKKCSDETCGYVHYGNPTPVVAAIVEHPSGILLARNHGWPEGMFGLVTGYLEAGETPETGVLRELREELGLEGEVVRLVGVHAFEPKNELIVTYHVKADGPVVLSEEIAAYKAIPEAKLRPWPMGTGLALREWLVSRGRTDV